MLNQNNDSDQDENASEDYNSDDETDRTGDPPLPWYQFNVVSTTIITWDSFFALVVWMNIIWTPLAICFSHEFYEYEESTVDWVAFDLLFESFWWIAFFINLNRVDLVRKIITP